MSDIKIKDIQNIKLEEAYDIYNNLGISIIIRDKKIKGLKLKK